MSAKVKVRRVVESPKSGGPILLNFEHAGVNKNVDITTRLVGAVYESDPKAPLSLPIGMHPADLKRKRVVVVQGETDMTYIGQSDGMLNTNTTGLRTFLAVRHKNKLKVYEAQRITVSPFINNRAHLAVKDSKKAEDSEERRKAAADLVTAFGSKKKRLSYERQQKNEINSEHMNQSINLASESAIVPKTIGGSTIVATDSEICPPRNLDTKDVKNVYSLNDILTPEDLDNLEDMAQGWLNADGEQIQTWKSTRTFSDYFFEMHRRLSSRKSDPSAVHTAKLVIYTELLICILKLKFAELRKVRVPVPNEFQQWLVDKALSMFTVVNAHKVRCRSEAYKDKTCCYIMVLVLLANDFLFDVQLMSTTLQIHINKLLTLTRVVGITTILNPATKQYKGLLKFPLTKPIEKRVMKKKTSSRQ